MPRCAISILDDDRRVEYQLDATYSYLPGERETPRTMAGPGSPAVADAVEVERVVLQGATMWFGDTPFYSTYEDDAEQAAISDWLLAKYPQEIADAVMEQHARSQCDDEFDPTDTRI